MKKIQGITDDYFQNFRLLLADASLCQLQLKFFPLQLGWFASVTYKDFTVKNIRVTCSYNILEQFSDLIPFGIACITADKMEPLFVEDFAASNAALCILETADLSALKAYYVAG